MILTKMFKQGKKHIVNFMIEFKPLAIKDDIYTIYLLKEEY